ncbi:hypothetical protein MVEN_00760500 [Mycena venus]|uniref:F-box domain-containing protein n=1 Tax=Mycena venus TaxID=2733690 RepID=A0A8H7D3P5_9AGAR|nr:hypothetical protein MVEN_00760500 [Mycena venus]
MSGIGILVPDVLREVMFWLGEIPDKFAFSQVSRYWRDEALRNHLFWASFACSGTGNAMLHIECVFHTKRHAVADWMTAVLDALVPYVARIETLDVFFTPWMGVNSDALLNSGLVFPALHTLRLEGPYYGRPPSLLLTVPQLHTLHLRRIKPANCRALLTPSLEDIQLYDTGVPSIETLFDIFNRCPRAWRVVLQELVNTHYSDEEIGGFARRSPLAPALRELDLRFVEPDDLRRVLNAGFSDRGVVLQTVTGCTSRLNLEVLTGALLPGVGPIVVFNLDAYGVELRDESGRIRHLQCWEGSVFFEIKEIWKHLSIHYNLRNTVREIRVGIYWDKCVDIFELDPPQREDGITLAFEANWDWDDTFAGYGGTAMPVRILRIPGVVKVEFYEQSGSVVLNHILPIFGHIEPPAGRKVEVCVGKKELLTRDNEEDNLKEDEGYSAFQTALSTFGDCWVICDHCVH